MESLHPLFVHFPIALLTAAFLIESVALLLKRPAWHRVALWNLGLGALGAALAVITGREAMAVAKHSLEIHRIMALHERLGYGVLALSGAVCGWRLFSQDRMGLVSRRIAWGLLGLACGMLALGAHLGGRLVYEFGVGGVYGRSAGGIEVVDQGHKPALKEEESMKKWLFALLVLGVGMWAGQAVAEGGHGEQGAHGAHEHAEAGAKAQKVTGEVVDLACYLSEGAMGPGHRECAQKCINSGLPVGIKSGDQLYLVVGGEHDPANKTLAPLAAKNVTAEGTVTERDGIHLLAVKKVTVNE